MKYGKPEEAAKAICYGMIIRSSEEHRNCYLITFSVDFKVLDLSDWTGNKRAIIDFLSGSFCGGTDLTHAMHETFRMLSTDAFSFADVLFISDFEVGEMPSETVASMREMQSHDVRFHALEIGRGASRKTIDLFDVHWRYEHKSNRICRVK